MGFLTESPAPLGTAVRLRISVPGDPEPLELRGTVVWSLHSSGRIYHVGVQFAPYGPAAGANDPAALERIIALESRYLPAGA